MAEFEKSFLECVQGKASCPPLAKDTFIRKYAEANKLLFALAQGQKEKALDAERTKLAKLAKTIFSSSDCKTVAMKSFFPFPYTDNDIDFVAISLFSKCQQALEETGFKVCESRSYLREPMKRFFASEGSNAFIHLHAAFSWNGVKYLDSESVWAGRKTISISGTAFNVPSPEHDFLITAAHAMFENKCLYLSDFLNILILSKNGLDWGKILEEAGEFHWKNGLLSFTAQVDALHKALYGKGILPEKLAGNSRAHPNNRILFPFILFGTFSSSFSKLLLDLASLKLLQLPRQLFSYTAVDFMLQRKALKEKAALEALQGAFKKEALQ